MNVGQRIYSAREIESLKFRSSCLHNYLIWLGCIGVKVSDSSHFSRYCLALVSKLGHPSWIRYDYSFMVRAVRRFARCLLVSWPLGINLLMVCNCTSRSLRLFFVCARRCFCEAFNYSRVIMIVIYTCHLLTRMTTFIATSLLKSCLSNRVK